MSPRVPSAALSPGFGVSRAALGRIAAAPWQQRYNENRRGVWVVLGLLGVLVAGVVLVAGYGAGPRFATMLLMGVAMLLLAGAWASYAGNLLTQNQPAAARLVPGHVQHLRLAMIAGGTTTVVLAVALAGVLFALMAPQRLPWPVLSLGVATIASIAVVALAASMRWPTLAFCLCLLPYPASMLHEAGADFLGRAVLDAWFAIPATATALCVVAQALAVAGLVQSGGARHVASFARRQRMRERFHRRAIGLDAGWSSDNQGTWDLRRRVFSAWFDLAVARRAPVMSRLFLGLNPAGHWTTHASATAMMGALLALFMALLRLTGQHEAADALLGGLVFGVMLLACTPLIQLRARFHGTRREQALLVLLPGVPRGPVLNRAIARRLLLGYAGVWVLAFVAVALLKQVPWAPGALARPAMSTFTAIGILPMAIGLCRRLDTLRAPTATSPVGVVLTAAASTGLVALLHLWVGVPLAALAVASAAITVAGVTWRWQALGRAPSALPVRD